MTGVALGIDTPTSNDANVVSELGQPPSIFDAFYNWTQPFPSPFVSSVLAMHSTPMITWLPATGRPGRHVSGYSLTDITGGQADGYISQWAQAAKAVGQPILVRLMHEMNGNWYPWGAVAGNTPAEYVAAFQHVVTLFQQAGATNVQFVWCVATSAASAVGTTTNNPISAYFPGDAYVSWVAMDGYSRKPAQPRSFVDIFSNVYQQLVSLSHRPVMVAETATVSDPSNPSYKAQWITAAFASVTTDFPRMKSVFYFDSRGNGFDYPFDGDSAAIAAIRAVASTPTFRAAVPNATLSF
jgi:hypothetical protein